MHLERHEDEPLKADLRLSSDERKLLNKSILYAVVKAATKSEAQVVPVAHNITAWAKILLHPDRYIGTQIINIVEEDTTTLASAVADYGNHARQVEEAQSARNLADELHQASYTLTAGHTPDNKLSSQEIDAIVAAQMIPRDIDGLIGKSD